LNRLQLQENRLQPYLVSALSLVVFVFLWQMYVLVFDTPSYLLPSPVQVFSAGWANRSFLPGHILATLYEALAGLLLGTLFGLIVASLINMYKILRSFFEPLLVISQSIPAVVLAPLFLVWFGFGFLPKILVVALITFFPVVLAALSGFDSVNLELEELFDSLGVKKLVRLFHLQIPAASEEIFAGLKISTSYAIFGAVIAEWMGGSTLGLGVYLQRSQASYRTDQVLAAVCIIAVLSVFFYGLIGLASRLMMPWKYA